ncbi:hypothetical protein BDN72DRAFT_808307 [Pluteus cervinus]|uniref:Uncharacterized protein n=1 Tax=Pluteus cervinus TaxID=181527 RepID=A0ACD3BHG2_9AGAR|nr:hypothetical protein BDN72DRAFT_808307 [Pluteus cervinus]
MDNWAAYLHWSFKSEHVLVPGLRLYSLGDFFIASILTAVLCLAERLLTFSLDKHWNPRFARGSRWRNALWRTCSYWVVTLLRLCYMLISMTFHLGLLLTIATSLAFGQFFIEVHNAKFSPAHSDRSIIEPLLHDQHSLASVTPSSIRTRPRSRSKPDDIFIHPSDSNIARADAVAIQLGITPSTDRVHVSTYSRDESPWKAGQGRDAARALLGGDRAKSRIPDFQIADDESDTDSSES